MMHSLVSAGLWNEISALAENAVEKQAAIAYVTTEEYIKFTEGDTLIVDAANDTIRTGQTSAKVLAEALKNKVALYSCAGLHAKVLLIDGVAVIGSANASLSSAKQLVEAALFTDQASVVAMTRLFLEKLRRKSKRIDDEFIERIAAIKVTPRRRGKPSTAPSIKLPTSQRTWLVGSAPFSEPRASREDKLAADGMVEAQKVVSRPTSWVDWRLTVGSSKFRREARPGDLIIIAWRETGEEDEPVEVYRPAPILKRREEKHGTRIYFEEFANSGATTMTWKQFLRLKRQVGWEHQVSDDPCCCVPEPYAQAFAELWNKA
jgi:hypothetical protein